ncbi:hypothetical protein RvY_01650 [Ramazzottius varieornatus]|uniref:Protein quiver n=1 Tax=Ramazzottius varieornatus TaxID=947166 RepID=A0A1D1UH43_RAMVA|nr:hypothetical protein RvY_01650 [Ramazzottius varieornatus]
MQTIHSLPRMRLSKTWMLWFLCGILGQVPVARSWQCNLCDGAADKFGPITGGDCITGGGSLAQDFELMNCERVMREILQRPEARNARQGCATTWTQTTDSRRKVIQLLTERRCALFTGRMQAGFPVQGCITLPSDGFGKTSVQCRCEGDWCNYGDYTESGLSLPEVVGPPPPPKPIISCYGCDGNVDRNGVATDCFLGSNMSRNVPDCREVMDPELRSGTHGLNPEFLCTTSWSQTTDSQGNGVANRFRKRKNPPYWNA